MSYKMDSYKNRIPMYDFPIRLDLGAGQYPKEGFVRMDFDPLGTDILWDVKDGIPLPDNSVSELYSSHFLEHFMPTDFHYILQEIWRVVAPGGKVEIRLPYGDLPQGKLPCHYGYHTESTFEAINIWFPHEDGNYWNLESITRDGIHITGIYTIVKK